MFAYFFSSRKTQSQDSQDQVINQEPTTPNQISEIITPQPLQPSVPIPKESKMECKNLVTNDNFELYFGKDFTDQLPPCSEKYLKELIILAKQAQESFRNEKKSIDQNTFQIFLEVLSKLKFNLKLENLLKQVVQEALKECKSSCKSQKIEDLLKNLRKIKDQIIIIDIPLLKAMFEKGDEAAKRIKGKSIFMLLGGSGVGKSTTIHFLAGSKMIETEVEGFTHIGPSEVYNSQAEEIMTGPFTFSVTKFINCVNVDGLMICDSPGFQDTQGPEVDIANGVGVIKGIRGCKSLLPGIVVSFKETGERYKGMKSLVRLIASMFTNLENHISTFKYIFTKFPKKDQAQVSVNIKSVLNSLDEKDKLDLQFVALLRDIEKKARQNKILFINPLTDDREEILEILRDSRTIADPNDAIQQYISKQSADALKNQCYLHQKSIVDSVDKQRDLTVKKSDIEFKDFIQYKLEELNFLNENLDKTYIKNAFDDSIKYISNFFNEQSRQLKSALEKCFDLNNMLTEADLEQFKKGLLTFKIYDILKIKYLSSETEGTVQLIEFLKNQVNNLIQMSQSENLSYSDKKILIILDKLKLISQQFKQFQSDFKDVNKIVFAYYDVMNQVIALMRNDLKKIEQLYQEFEFEKTAKTFFQLKECQKNLKDHLENSFDSQLQEVIENFQSFLESLANKVSSLLIIDNQDDKNDKTIQIANIINNIESFQIQFQAEKDQDILKIVTTILQSSYGNILEFITNTATKIEGVEYNDCYFENIKIFVFTIKNLRDRISVVKDKSAEIFYQLVERIFSQVNLAIKESKEILDVLLQDVHVSETEFFAFINTLQFKLKILVSINWLDQLKKGYSTQTCEEFFQQIKSCCKILQDKVKRIQLTIKDYDNLNFISTIINQTQGLKVFDEINPNSELHVTSIADSIQSKFNEQIQEISSSIQQVIDELEEINKMNEEKKLENSSIKNIEECYIFLKNIKLLKKQIEYIPLKIQCLISQKDQLKSLIENHHDQCLKYIHDSFSRITSYNGEKREEFIKQSSDLENLLVNIKKVQEKTVNFNKHLKTDSLFEKSNKLFSIQADDFRHQLEIKVNNQTSIEVELEIIRLLKRVDLFHSGEKYADIYKDFSSKNFYNIQSSYIDVYKKIREHNFSQIESDLLEIQSRQNSEKQFTQICYTITSELKELIDAAKAMAIQTECQVGMTMERINDIMKSVRKIKECQKLVQFINYQTLNADIKEILDIVSQNFMKRLNQTENQIKQLNFFQANEQLSQIDMVKNCLGADISKEILAKIETINTIKEESLQKIFDDYEKLEITEYSVKAPKTTLEKLEKANLDSVKDKLVEIIIQKFRKRIAELKKEGTKKSEMLLGQLKYLGPSLGHVLEAQITPMIQNALDELKNEEENRKTQIEQAKDDPNQLKSFLEKSRITNHVQEEEKIKSYFKVILEKHFKVISRKINTLDEEVTNALEEITEIKKNLDGLHLTAQFHKIKETQRKFKKLFNDAVSKTHDLIKIEKFDVKSDGLNETLNGLQFDDDSENCSPVTHEKLIEIISLRLSMENVVKALISDFDKKLLKEIQLFIENIHKNQNIILKNLSNEYPNLQEIKNNLKLVRKNTNFFIDFKEEVQKLIKADEKLQVNNLSSILIFTDYIEKINAKLVPVTQEIENLCKQLINENTKHQEVQRQDFYKTINLKLQFLNNLTIVYEKLNVENDNDTIIQECQRHFQNNVDQMYETIITHIEKKKLNIEDVHDISIKYCNLIDIDEFISKEFKPLLIPIDEIKEKIQQKINFSFENATQTVNANQIAENIILLKLISKIHQQFKNITCLKIDKILEKINKKKGLNILFANVQEKLNLDIIGKEVTGEHQAFKSQSVYEFNQKTKNQGIDYVMDKIEGSIDYKYILGFIPVESSNIDKKYLLDNFKKFTENYDQFVKEVIYNDIDEGLKNYKSIIQKYQMKTEQSELKDWQGAFKDDIPIIMAYIFAMWTLMNCEYYKQTTESEDEESKEPVDEESAEVYLQKPHPAQIVGILRILGLGNKVKTGFLNNLVQIGTGEGKSVTIAVTAIILAILGFDVSCACYSEYLSKRDKAAFENLFEFLQVGQQITYGTFDQLCEKVINKRVNVRSAITNLFVNNSAANEIQMLSNKLQALIIDEVDVFFSKSYYGMQYGPVASIKDATITQLIEYIWNNKDNKLTLSKIKLTQEYTNLITKFSKWQSIINEQVLEMLDAVKNFEGQDYHLDESKGRIGYQDNDKISYDITYGYKTTFLYFAEFVKNRIQQHHLYANTSLNLNCGNFSYAEMPKFFDIVMGATGTLRTLCEDQQKIIKEEYQIKQFTFMPSVYGENLLNFDKLNDVIISKRDTYYKEICQQAQIQLNIKRPVLIFFEDAQKLQEFFKSSEFSDLKRNYQPDYLTEAANSDEKDNVVKRATTRGSLNLFTKSYGRGTDFITRDDNVQASGGSFIIQTFFSDDISEETQIKGRTARQGERGSYIMILLQDDLEKVNVSDNIIIQEGKKGMYDFMDKVRTQKFNSFFKAHIDNASIAREVHNDSLKFQQTILKSDLDGITNFILKYNKGKEEITSSRIVILMDATGSMGHVIERTKQTVVQMFEQAHEILKDNKLPDDCFSVQFAAYRNYSSTEANLLQVSPWTTKPYELKQFLNGVQARDGMGYEAVEVGLWHALSEHNKEPISSIILIGDAPPNTLATHKQYITQIAPKFRTVSYFEKEVESIIEKQIPVNAFYVVADSVKDYFEKISKQTKGESYFLDIGAQNGAQQLTYLVTKQILAGVDRSKGMQGNLVSQYVKKYLPASL